MQYLFAHELHQPAGSKSAAESEAFWDLHSAKSGARKFAESLIDGVLSKLETIDKAIMDASTNFSLERLANVDRNIIRLAVYELMNTPDLPAPVIMNEAIEIAKKLVRLNPPASSMASSTALLGRCVRKFRAASLRRHSRNPKLPKRRMAGFFKSLISKFSKPDFDWDELEAALIAGDLGRSWRCRSWMICVTRAASSTVKTLSL